MSNLRPYFLTGILFLLAFANLARAQGQFAESPTALAKAETEWMRQVLELDSLQLRSIANLNLEYAQLFFVLNKDQEDKSDLALKKKEMKESKFADLKKVFTDGQWKEYSERHSEWISIRADLVEFVDNG